MQRFLEAFAGYLHQKYGHELSGICIVLPNRRSGVFLKAYLQKLLDKPVIGPRITTINELIQSLSDLQPADKLLLISVLYDIFRKQTGTAETFDEFFFWGETLLADFDDLDKYRVNAGDLFRNVAELKEVDRHFDYLTDTQKSVLRHFWGSLRDWENHSQERDFVSFWNNLLPVYETFRRILLEKGMGYSGMIYREVTDLMDEKGKLLTGDRYFFAGLNALNACEMRLMDWCREQGKADFFWDYDDYYLNNPSNDAGRFLRWNLGRYPAPDDFQPEFTRFSRPKKVEIVSVNSNFGQSQVIPEFIREVQGGMAGRFDQTAIVLADESLLFPVMGAIPESVGTVNVTMGYPVKNSPVSGFLNLLSLLIRNSAQKDRGKRGLYYRLVSDILNHQLLAGIEREKVKEAQRRFIAENRLYIDPEELAFSPLHRRIFTLPGSTGNFPDYFKGILEQLYTCFAGDPDHLIIRELIYHLYFAMGKLETLLKDEWIPEGISISANIFFRLMNQYIGKLSVPFEGEPLSGLQVMGILETRCLDFDNIIIIGLNEDIWPRSSSGTTLIPYNLRKAFGLPGIDDQDAMYSYHFYRLVQRADRVSATWSSVREGMTGGEMSRYAFQLKHLSPHAVVNRSLDFPLVNMHPLPVNIQSGTEISRHLLERNADGRLLSPSAINTWLTCRLKFYFRYVLGIEEPEEVLEEIDRRSFGNIFHKAVENLYEPFVGQVVDKEVLRHIKKDSKKIDQAIRSAFATEFYKADNAAGFELEGKALLIHSTIRTYIHNLLDKDIATAPFVLHSLENSYRTSITVSVDGQEHDIRIGGKIDRLDEVDGSVRVIDYKTGNLSGSDLACNQLEELFDPEARNLKKEIIQALVYSYILKQDYFRDKPVTATVYAILKLNDGTFHPEVRAGKQVMEIGNHIEQWEELLKQVLSDIFSAKSSFSQTPHADRCVYCPYNEICRR